MRLIKKLLKISLVLCLSACVAVALLYALQSYGVCLKKGRVLSPEELRKEVLASFVKLEIYNSDVAKASRGSSGAPKISIGRYDPEVGIEKILEKIYLGETSIEENLGLESLVKRWPHMRKPLSEEQLKEPFIFVRYESATTRATDDSGLKIVKGSTKGGVFISSNFQEEIYERKGFFSKLWSVRYFFENPNSFYNTLCGYYNNYYYNQAYAFSRECTDEMFADKNLQERCREKRREDYEQRIEKLKEPRPPHTTVMLISNCGTILTVPHEMGLRSRYKAWTYRDNIGKSTQPKQ